MKGLKTTITRLTAAQGGRWRTVAVAYYGQLLVTVKTDRRKLPHWVVRGAVSRFHSGEFDQSKPYELDDTGTAGLGFFRFECTRTSILR